MVVCPSLRSTTGVRAGGKRESVDPALRPGCVSPRVAPTAEVSRLSFSTQVKNELARLIPGLECCQRAELKGLLDARPCFSGGGAPAIYLTANAAVARKVITLFNRVYGVHPPVAVRTRNSSRANKLYVVGKGVEPAEVPNGWPEDFPWIDRLSYDGRARDCCRRAYLRGFFLSAGSVGDPRRGYHLELIARDGSKTAFLMGLMGCYEIQPGTTGRQGGRVIYLKGAEAIAQFLNVVGAHAALLEFESLRVYKEIKNAVNRLVNCETANLNKVVDAALQQVQDIELIHRQKGLENLPPALREMAWLRLKNPEASLKELGELLEPPLGKSGVNHRLRRLKELAEVLRKKEPGNRSPGLAGHSDVH